MKVKIIDAKKALIYQTTTDGETEMPGEPALLVEKWDGDGSISIDSENGYVGINYDTLPALIKILQGVLKDKSFYEIKL